MNLSTREFLQVLGAGAAAGMGLKAHAQTDGKAAAKGLYDISLAHRMEAVKTQLLASLEDLSIDARQIDARQTRA